MTRWLCFLFCAILGLVTLVCGLRVPVHLRAVDASVLDKAGRNTPALIGQGLALADGKKLGAARLLLRVAQDEKLTGIEKLGLAVTNLAAQHPGWQAWGGGDPRLERLFESDPNLPRSGSEPFTEFVIREENRRVVLDLLQASPHPVVQELLRCRSLTNTVLLDPSSSSSGQPFDTSLAISGLLLEEGCLTAGLSNAMLGLATEANRGGNSQPLEQMLLDWMSLGQRFDWDQLATFVARIEDPETLRLLAGLARRNEDQLPALFSAVELSGKPADVARYLVNFSQTGLMDLKESLRYGAGGVNELLGRNQRLYASRAGQPPAARPPFGTLFAFAVDHSWRTPGLALACKWFLYLTGGFLLAAALHFARPAASALEKPLQVRGVHVAREVLFALGFLLVVVFLSEPFLTQENQKAEFRFRPRLPVVGGVTPAGTTHMTTSIMSPSNAISLLLFFVLQGLIYTACVVKLAEIRRQRVEARVRLKLLENEDHLFDAGLYLGFLGTIVSFILYSLGVVPQFSLMVAYSSTSFGIIFVSFFKIFHLRPARRKLLLEAEAEAHEPAPPVGVHTYATSP